MLLAGKPRRAEVVQFPHHGSKHLDPTGLVAWTGADWLVASQGLSWGTSPAPEMPGSAVRCCYTATAGAVACRGNWVGWWRHSDETPVSRLLARALTRMAC